MGSLMPVQFLLFFFFFFQAEDGIRDRNVTGAQTCALPIWSGPAKCPIILWARLGFLPLVMCVLKLSTTPTSTVEMNARSCPAEPETSRAARNCKIGRASCRERVEI